jgi:putative ABC transport system ATP-binding protein
MSAMPADRDLVVLRDIRRGYGTGPGRAEVLQGVSGSVARGEMVALTGGSGSGKTTLVNILGLLDVPSAGGYVLDGVETACLSPGRRARLRRDRIGFLFQNFELLTGLSAVENVALPLLYRGAGRAEAEAQAAALLDSVGLAGHGAKTPLQLSGGQQQRVALARAVASRPALLLADEPTGNLDIDTAKAIIALLRAHCIAGQSAAIVVTHDPMVAAACDRWLVLQQGRLVERQAGAA